LHDPTTGPALYFRLGIAVRHLGPWRRILFCLSPSPPRPNLALALWHDRHGMHRPLAHRPAYAAHTVAVAVPLVVLLLLAWRAFRHHDRFAVAFFARC